MDLSDSPTDHFQHFATSLLKEIAMFNSTPKTADSASNMYKRSDIHSASSMAFTSLAAH